MRRLASSQTPPSLNTVLTRTGHVLQGAEATQYSAHAYVTARSAKILQKKIRAEQRKQVAPHTCGKTIQLTNAHTCRSLVTIWQQSFIYVINYSDAHLRALTAWLISSFSLELSRAKPLCRSECLTFSI